MLLLPASLAPRAHAQYMELIPNGRNVPGAAGGPAHGMWHAVGHKHPDPMHHPSYIVDGFPRNTFGTDFASAGFHWTEALCRLDSDGDGATNGQELGDPGCVWKLGQVPQRVHNITHPGLTPKQAAKWSAMRRADVAKHRSEWLSNSATRRSIMDALFAAWPLFYCESRENEH